MSRREDLDNIQVQAVPSGIGCISWSEDGDLALGSGEYVHVLTPKRGIARNTSNDSSTGFRQWNSTRIKANAFTFDEWPEVKPGTFSTFSLGEEQSASTVSTITWSPAGIAKHRRCLLAVLTTNSLLSLWETNGELGKWERVCLLQPTLQEHFGKPVNDEDPLRKKTRIRSFCWSPPVGAFDDGNLSNVSRTSVAGRKWGKCFLTVANDDQDIVVLSLQRVQVSEREASLWDVKVITAYSFSRSLPLFPQGTVEPHSLFADFVASSGLITDVAWSPWTISNTSDPYTHCARALLSVVRGHEFSLLLVDLALRSSGPDQNDNTLHMELKPGDLGTEFHGTFVEALAWHPLVQAETFVLAVVRSGVPTLLTIGKTGNVIDDQSAPFPCAQLGESFDSRSIANRYLVCWSGRSHTRGSSAAQCSSLQLDVTTNTGDGMVITAQPPMDWHSAESIMFSDPPWLSEIQDAVRSFTAKYELEDAAVPRIHGLTANGLHLAICFSVHPKDVLEYVTPATDVSRILFHKLPAALDGREEDSIVVHTPQNVRQFILRWTLHHFNAIHDKEASILDKKLVLTQKDVVPVSTWDPRMVALYCSFLENMKLPVEAGSDNISHTEHFPAEDGLKDDLKELCEICGTELDRSSPEGAICETGHVYGRCSLSFLAIQQPGISKRCSSCDRQYLDLDKALEENALSIDSLSLNPLATGGGRVRELSKDALLKQLFEAFDYCPYCQSRFCG